MWRPRACLQWPLEGLQLLARVSCCSASAHIRVCSRFGVRTTLSSSHRPCVELSVGQLEHTSPRFGFTQNIEAIEPHGVLHYMHEEGDGHLCVDGTD